MTGRGRAKDVLAGMSLGKHKGISLKLPEVSGHPNRQPFEGCLTLIDVASDKAPSGARGHCVVLTLMAAEDALPGLLGMAIDFKDGWDGHDARRKCGIITEAQIAGCELRVKGFVFVKDFPEILGRVRIDDLGMSYEISNAHVADIRAKVWTLTRVTFTGAALLQKSKAAYSRTSFRVPVVKQNDVSDGVALFAVIDGGCDAG